jgi:hypothetical protein
MTYLRVLAEGKRKKRPTNYMLNHAVRPYFLAPYVTMSCEYHHGLMPERSVGSSSLVHQTKPDSVPLTNDFSHVLFFLWSKSIAVTHLIPFFFYSFSFVLSKLGMPFGLSVAYGIYRLVPCIYETDLSNTKVARHLNS